MKKQSILITLQHKLTLEQLQELSEKYPDCSLENLSIIDADLFQKLSNCNNKVDNLENLSFKLANIICEYNTVILPIGSPAFNFLLNQQLFELQFTGHVLFAHSEKFMKVDGLPELSLKI